MRPLRPRRPEATTGSRPIRPPAGRASVSIDFRSGVHYRPETEMATSFWYRSPA